MGGGGRARGESGIHGGASEGADEQEAGGDGQVDVEAGDRAEGAALVDRGGEDHEDQEERGDGFKDPGREAGKNPYHPRGARGPGRTGVFGGAGPVGERRGGAARGPRAPTKKNFTRSDACGE